SCNVISSADRFHRVEREAPGEHGHATEQRLLRRLEETIAPVKRCTHRLLARWRRAATADEQCDAIVEPLQNLGDANCTCPCSGQLQRERNTVETMADTCDHRRVALG